MNTLKIALIAAALAASASVNADVIVDWDLDGMVGNEASHAANSVATGITGNNLLRGVGLTGSAGGNSINASGWNGQATDYFSFGFTVANGESVDLTSLVIATRSSATGPGVMGLYYSGDNFSHALYTFNQSPGANFVNSIVDLSALHNLIGNVEFRIEQMGNAAANGGTTAGAGTFRVSEYYNGSAYTNLQLNGSTMAVTPLPAAMWLLGSGVAGLLGFARRRAAV